MSSESPHPLGRSPEQWRQWLIARGERPYRAEQIFSWIHQHGVLDPEQMTNLPKSLRATLADEGVGSLLAVDQVRPAEDGSSKLLLRLRDDNPIETVLLPSSARSHDADAAAGFDEDDRTDELGAKHTGERGGAKVPVTQCVSTQVGCAMGCIFCASGIAGLKRHLSAAEIVGQLIAGRASLAPKQRLRNVVFMGMGEPLHNFDETVASIELMTHPKGLALSPRRITVSTSGLVPQIDALGQSFDGKVGLAISLHQADDEKRSALMPINRKYPLAELMRALKRYPLKGRGNITIEYTLVQGQNDDPNDARKLAKLLKGLRVKVNLIPMNPIEHSKLGPPDWTHVERFQSLLRQAGLLCFIRRRRGDDVAAACGQLALQGAEPNVRFIKRQPKS